MRTVLVLFVTVTVPISQTGGSSSVSSPTSGVSEFLSILPPHLSPVVLHFVCLVSVVV